MGMWYSLLVRAGVLLLKIQCDGCSGTTESAKQEVQEIMGGDENVPEGCTGDCRVVVSKRVTN